MNWSYSLTAGLGLGGLIKFDEDYMVRIYADGSAGPVSAKCQRRFRLNST